MILSKNLEQALLEITTKIDSRMAELLPDAKKFNESKLVEAMRYSALSSGKRIRPFLTIIAANLFGVKIEDSIDVAVAIECLHVYSLIHDDLPAMDDDDFRRGKPSCHKKFDEATAILAGDSLLTYAFEILSDKNTNPDAEIRCELINIISKAIGFNGMVGGQMIDLESSKKNLDAAGIARLQRLKTGELFMAAIEAGAVIGKADSDFRKALIFYAHDIGLAFQIKDDIMDHGCQDNVSKAKPDNASIVSAIGIDNAKEQLQLLHDQAIAHLKPFGAGAVLFKELAQFIVSRNA